MDGRIIQRRGTGPSQGKAKVALNRVLAALETAPAVGTAVISSASKLSTVVSVWCVKKAAETAAAKPNCLRAQTLEEYMRLLNREVLDRKAHDRELAGLGNLRLSELTVQVLETFLTALEAKHASQPRNVRAALAGPLNLAVRYGAIPVSPLKLVESFHKPQREVYSLTAEQVPRFRTPVARFGHEPGKPGPRNSRQLADFVEVNLALALRPGELLALHWEDISGLDTDKPMVAIRRTVVTARSRGTKAQPETKNQSSKRDLSIPQFAAELLRSRKLLSEGPLVFPTRNATVIATAQYQKWLRACSRDRILPGHSARSSSDHRQPAARSQSGKLVRGQPHARTQQRVRDREGISVQERDTARPFLVSSGALYVGKKCPGSRVPAADLFCTPRPAGALRTSRCLTRFE